MLKETVKFPRPKAGSKGLFTCKARLLSKACPKESKPEPPK